MHCLAPCCIMHYQEMSQPVQNNPYAPPPPPATSLLSFTLFFSYFPSSPPPPLSESILSHTQSKGTARAVQQNKRR